MKTNRFLYFVAAVVVAHVQTLPVEAQQRFLRTDADGNPLTPLNLGGTNVGGTLAPARLGTGTPSGNTVLRGDGTWAGTTPTGNTIAATGRLLAGDGTGNAVAVASSTDLQRVLQLRADTSRALSGNPNNLLGRANLVIRNGTINADGTLTIPAHDYIQWNAAGDITTHALRYCYAVATTDQPVGTAGGFYINAFYNGYNNVGFDGSGATSSQPEPGVARYTFTNSVGNGGYAVYVTNATTAPVTIYPPVMTLVDAGVRPVQSYAETVPVPSQPVADLDFTTFANGDRTTSFMVPWDTTVAIDGVGGSEANPGTLYAPKLSLQQPVTANTVFGLYRGSIFRDSLPFSALGNTRGVLVQDLSLGANGNLPVISALDPVANGSFTSGGAAPAGTYLCTWTAQDNTVANDGYQNVYVVEINTAAEAAFPVSSRRRMTDASLGDVAGTVGSACVQSTGGTGWQAFVHPSDGLAPGSGSYRYEVVARYSPANWSPSVNAGDGALHGLELIGGSFGYGSIGSPLRFAGDRLAVLHATTHGAVLGSGSLQRSFFYELGDPTSIQLAWYTGNPAGLRWSVSHCLFYANVGDHEANCLISHSSSTNYDRGNIDATAFLGARWSNGSLHGVAIDYDNVSGGLINHVYVQAIEDIFGFNMPLAAEVKNSVFRQVNKPRIGLNFHDNIVLAESGSDPTSNNNRYPGACLLQQNGASAVNNILWARGIATGVSGDDPASGLNFYPGVTSGTIQRNIVVLNPASLTVPGIYANFPSGAPSGFNIDYNLVVNLAAGGFGAIGGTGNYLSWPEYQAAYPGLDQHSMYVDLSADPRGLKAVFMDPINGDFRWAQTDVARQCAAYCTANHVGPATVTTHWPTVPTVDQALRALTDQ